MPTFAEAMSAVSALLTDYGFLVAAAAVVGIGGSLWARLQRGGR